MKVARSVVVGREIVVSTDASLGNVPEALEESSELPDAGEA